MSCWYCPVGVQGTVLGFTVDLSALPYLLRPFPGSSLSGRPRSVGPSWLRLCLLEKSCKQRFGASPVGDAGRSRKQRWPASRLERRAGVRSECCSFSARPSGRRGGPESEASVVPPRPGLPVREAGQSRRRAPSFLGQAFRSERGAGVEGERRPSLARPSGLSLGI